MEEPREAKEDVEGHGEEFRQWREQRRVYLWEPSARGEKTGGSDITSKIYIK